MARSLKIAVIGQSVFAKDVYNLIKKNGHTIVGVFTIPDKNGREVKRYFKAHAIHYPAPKSSLMMCEGSLFKCLLRVNNKRL